MDLQRDSPLFDKILPIQVQENAQDLRHANLVFRILQGTQPTNVVGQVETVYHFEITDDRDPYFLYYFLVGEQDFPQFKREQSILVDFHLFPLKLLELIELCLSTATLNQPVSSPSSSEQPSLYNAKLDIMTGIFSIIESNKFKQLTHICLPLRLGDDNAIKMYLASRLSLVLEHSKRQTREIITQQKHLESQRDTNHILNHELKELRSKKEIEMQSVQANHMSEYNTLQKSMLDAQELIRSKFEQQVESQKQHIAKLQQDLHAKMLSSEQQVGDLNQEKTTLEFQLRDLQRQFNLNEQDRKHLVQELDAYVSFKKEFEAERHTSQKEMVGIQSKLESLTLQLQDKELQIENHQTLARAYQENKGNLEERLQVFAKQVQEIELERKKWEDKYTELEKRIENKKEEMKEYYETLMIKNEIIRKQEGSIEDFSKKYKDTEEKFLHAQEQIEQLTHQVTVTQQRLLEAQERIQESNQIIQENKGIISYLGEEITRWQLGERSIQETLYGSHGLSSGHAGTSPSPSTGNSHTSNNLPPLSSSTHASIQHPNSTSKPTPTHATTTTAPGTTSTGTTGTGISATSMLFSPSTTTNTTTANTLSKYHPPMRPPSYTTPMTLSKPHSYTPTTTTTTTSTSATTPYRLGDTRTTMLTTPPTAPSGRFYGQDIRYQYHDTPTSSTTNTTNTFPAHPATTRQAYFTHGLLPSTATTTTTGSNTGTTTTGNTTSSNRNNRGGREEIGEEEMDSLLPPPPPPSTLITTILPTSFTNTTSSSSSGSHSSSSSHSTSGCSSSSGGGMYSHHHHTNTYLLGMKNLGLDEASLDSHLLPTTTTTTTSTSAAAAVASVGAGGSLPRETVGGRALLTRLRTGHHLLTGNSTGMNGTGGNGTSGNTGTGGREVELEQLDYYNTDILLPTSRPLPQPIAPSVNPAKSPGHHHTTTTNTGNNTNTINTGNNNTGTTNTNTGNNNTITGITNTNTGTTNTGTFHIPYIPTTPTTTTSTPSSGGGGMMSKSMSMLTPSTGTGSSSKVHPSAKNMQQQQHTATEEYKYDWLAPTYAMSDLEEDASSQRSTY